MSDSTQPPFIFSTTMNTRDETTGKPFEAQQRQILSIAILGNFRGQRITDSPIGRREFIEIDRYNFDEVMAAIGPELSVKFGPDQATSISFQTLKDFQPDRLYQNLEPFSRLADLRKRLDNPATFKQAMQELDWPEPEPQSGESPAPITQPAMSDEITPSNIPADTGENLLDSILSETQNRAASLDETIEQQSRSMVDALVKQIVSNKARPVSRDSRQDEMVAALDDEITQIMRQLLHDPAFQALEAAWRCVHFMVRRIHSGKAVKLYLLDIERNELARDVAADDISASALYRLVCDRDMGGIDWDLIVADYRFSADIDDILTLSQLGIIAQAANARFIAAADEKLIGCTSFAATPRIDDWDFDISDSVTQGWTLLRKSPVAGNISLALPRFMLRAPYGQKSTPVKAFAFEEMLDPPAHKDYLWGNPAFVKAEQIARAFIEGNGQIQYANVVNSEDMPVHYYESGGRAIVKPCAEIALTDEGAARMIAAGLIPLWSVKNTDRIHSGDFFSIAV